MTHSTLTRKDNLTMLNGAVIHAVDVYAIRDLPAVGSQRLSKQEILLHARDADGDPVPADNAVDYDGIVSPRFRVSRSLQSRKEAWVTVTWGDRFRPGGGVTDVQSFSGSSDDRAVLIPHMQAVSDSMVSFVELRQHRIDRLHTTSIYRRLLSSSISPESVNAFVAANRRKLYNFGGLDMILKSHRIVPANATQFYADTYFLSKSALPAIERNGIQDGSFPVDELPVLGEYVQPVPFSSAKTSVKTATDLYEQGVSIPWMA